MQRSTFLGAATATLAALAGAAQAGELLVTIDGVRSSRGTLRLCVFDAPGGFPDCHADRRIRRAAVPARAGRDTISIADVPEGIHAVSVYHDERDLGRLDSNFLGIPRDGVGASNNPRSRFGPPSFADAAFQLPATGGRISIVLVYP